MPRAAPLRSNCRKRNIPYRIYGGLSPSIQRKEIKDLIAYFRLVANPADDESLKRVVNYPARGIGKTTLDRGDSWPAAQRTICSLWDVLTDEPFRQPSDLKGSQLGPSSRISCHDDWRGLPASSLDNVKPPLTYRPPHCPAALACLCARFTKTKPPKGSRGMKTYKRSSLAGRALKEDSR